METERRVVEEKSIEIRLRNKKKRTKKVESLYLCFNRTMMGGPGRYVHFVLSIKLTDLFSSKSNEHPSGGAGDGDGDGDGEGSETIITIDGNSKFRQVGYIEGDEEDGIPYYSNSGVFRSKIIIAGVAPPRFSTDDFRGTNKILVFDPTADPHPEPDSNNIRIKPFQMTEGYIARKPYPLLVELEGRLYALGNCPRTLLQSPLFEVFNPTHQKWSPLQDPPVFKNTYSRPDDFSCVVVGTKFLVSSKCKEGVFCFDVTEPNPEWKILSSLPKSLPFDHFNAFAVKDEENKDGAFVIFSYCHFPPEESSISVSIMSQQCDSWKTMKSLKLPQLPPEFYSEQYTGFFHLGGRRLCLFMHKYFSSLRYGMFPVEFPQYSDKGLLLVVPFEYKIIKLGSDSCSMTANFEALRIIEYTPKLSDRNSHQILNEELYGAFVLNTRWSG